MITKKDMIVFSLVVIASGSLQAMDVGSLLISSVAAVSTVCVTHKVAYEVGKNEGEDCALTFPLIACSPKVIPGRDRAKVFLNQEKTYLATVPAVGKMLQDSLVVQAPLLSDENRAQVYLAHQCLQDPKQALYPTIRRLQILQATKYFLPNLLDPLLIPVAQSDKYKKWYVRELAPYYKKKIKPKFAKIEDTELLSLKVARVNNKAHKLKNLVNQLAVIKFAEAQPATLSSNSQCNIS